MMKSGSTHEKKIGAPYARMRSWELGFIFVPAYPSIEELNILDNPER